MARKIYRNIYEFSTEDGDSWNGFRLKLQKDGIPYRRDFPLAAYNGSRGRCRNAVRKARTELYKKLNIR